jgi:[ribosomal protein S5]-alanine N-acetyltransferase
MTMMPSEAAAILVDSGELRTERLIYRLPDPSLAPALSDYYGRNAEHFAAYCPRRPDGFHSIEAWQERALGLRQASLTGKALHLLISLRGDTSGDIVGDINFTNVVRGVLQAAYLGYELDRAHVGRGLMGEALPACIDHVFRYMNLHRLMANYVPSNERSGRLLRKLGFSVEGYARDYLFLDGVWKDHILTSLINPNF